MDIKRITIRLSPELHESLLQAANEAGISLNSLAVEALQTYVARQIRQMDRFPIGELADLLAPAAEASGLDEAELLQHAKVIRERLWHERYMAEVQNAVNETAM
ncbi:MAG: toxin-antitoxin system HicB family antitoxin [Anaerolineales bacterium]|nr:toxin-antitoxin system HicB family antitoxin [Anaerolineales bacterium]